MKRLIIMTLVFGYLSNNVNAQTSPGSADSTVTNTVPEGLKLKNGKLYIAKGFKTKKSEDGQSIVVYRINNSGGTGGGSGLEVKCGCPGLIPVACGVVIHGDGSITCATCVGKTCSMLVTARTANQSKEIRWRELVLPAN